MVHVIITGCVVDAAGDKLLGSCVFAGFVLYAQLHREGHSKHT
jgi:hypothetical protein